MTVATYIVCFWVSATNNVLNFVQVCCFFFSKLQLTLTEKIIMKNISIVLFFFLLQDITQVYLIRSSFTG